MPSFPRPLTIIRSYAISLSIWFLLSLVVSYQWHLLSLSSGMKETFQFNVLLPVVRFGCFGLLTPVIFYFVLRYPIATGSIARRSFAYLGGAVAFVPTYALLRWLILPAWSNDTYSWVARSIHSYIAVIAGTFAEQLSMYVAIVLAAHTFSFFKQARDEESEKLRLQKALAASELEMLKMQLHPHFLFNTLQGISVLVSEDAEQARRMIVSLSDLLRVTLKHSSSDLSSLAQELKFVRAYLEIEGMRLGPRLKTIINCDDETLGMMVPQLILQCPVENAITHGIACCRQGGWIRIESMRSGSTLELHILNSVGGKSDSGAGVGINNTKARLTTLYGSDASFEFSEAAGIAHACIRIPILGTSHILEIADARERRVQTRTSVNQTA